MAGGGVRVENLNRNVRELKNLGVDVEDLKDAFSAIATEAVDAVVAYVPRASGRLADSVRGNRAQAKAVVRAGRAAVPYAGAINYGWPARGIEAAEYMQKGDAEMQPRAVARLEQELETRIRARGLR